MQQLPVCAKCRQERPCVKVSTALGDKSICIADCFKLWGIMQNDIKRRVADLLNEHHEDFFDEPTRRDIQPLKENK